MTVPALPTGTLPASAASDGGDGSWRAANIGWIGAALVAHGLLLAVLAMTPPSPPIQPAVPLMVAILPAASEQAPAHPAPAPPAPKAPPPSRPTPNPAPAKPVVAPAPAKSVTAPTPAPAPMAAAAPASAPATPAAATAQAAPSTSNSASSAASPATGPVSAPRFDADYLSNPAPVYPSLSRRMGEQGRVMLRAHVLPSGSADQVDVKTSSGSSRLDNAALEAVRKWKFVPARQGGEAVAAWVQIPITFNLEN